jgi:hypothetical protein
MRISELTMTELRLKHAQLKHQAAEARSRWRIMPTGPRAVAAGKRVRALDARAEDYRMILETVAVMNVEKVIING